MGRSVHATCCLNYGQDHPQLLVHGGYGNDGKTLGDMWILDVNTWTEVSFVLLLLTCYIYKSTECREADTIIMPQCMTVCMRSKQYGCVCVRACVRACRLLQE